MNLLSLSNRRTNGAPQTGKPQTGEPADSEPTGEPFVNARRVMGASVLWWILTLGFFSWAVTFIPSDPSGRLKFWIMIREHDISAAWLGLLIFALSWLATPVFARLDWARLAVFIERRLLVLCALAFCLYGAIAFWPHQHFTYSWDEYSLLTQSRIFATGQMSGWVPPVLLQWIWGPGYGDAFFAVSSKSGHFVPIYWPGLAILGTPFTALGVSWLCNPFLGALSLWGVHRLTLRVSGSREAAAWAWAFTLASPVVALNAATYFAMSAHLLFNVFYCLLLLRDDRRGAFFAGVVGGFALALHNPFPHLAFALPWLAFVVWKRRQLIVPLLLGYLVFAVPLVLGWSSFLDSFDPDTYAQVVGASTPFAKIWGRVVSLATLPTPYIVLSRVGGLGKTVVWAVPGLLVLAWLGWRNLGHRAATSSQFDTSKVDNRALRLLAAAFLSTFLVYFIVPFDQTLGWGFRYIHPAWFALPVLSATFLALVPANHILRAFFAALCVLTLAFQLPLRAVQADNFISQHRAQVPMVTAPVSITFIKTKHGSFTADLLQNDPFLRNDDWHLRDRGAPANAQLVRQYLVNPVRKQSGVWGEIWTGSAIRHPQFPPPRR